ncbi:MAG TPA: N-acetyl-gamma-glutamyl-phosphate reductase [Methylovirgula sp.]|nr:N-acetyl-gamma-glutamyl-phosphate reductase [Methylovirgula sp.]
MGARIFIDGQAGTTGLGIAKRLAAIPEIALASLPEEQRKDPAAKADLLRQVDLVILCLPDAAAKETVTLAAGLGNAAPRILDASSAHRVAEGWVYGFPELAEEQGDKIRSATRVSNPGCYATGAIALLRPLVDAGLVSADYPITINAVSGYTGRGRSYISYYESEDAPPFELYALGLEHKHVPEIMTYSRLARRPIFVPSVGKFAQGMLVSIPLFVDELPARPKPADLSAALAAHYAGSPFVRIVPADSAERVEPQALNGSNNLELRVFGNEARGHAVLVAKLDNLGKGASGAAVQNLGLMLGLDVTP